MRIIFLCVALTIIVVSVPAIGWSSQIIDEGSVTGAGVMVLESPYKGADDYVYPVPVLIFESKRFFVDKTVAGYYFNDKMSPIRWAVIGSVRLQGYKADDSNDLNGMQDRDRALDGGLRISWKNKIIDMILDGVTDVSGTHEGQEISVSVTKELFQGFLTPKAAIKWQSDGLVDYYYGVRPGEARAGRVEYSADAGLEYMAGITIAVPLGEKWALFGDIQCTFLGDDAGDSPITDDDTLMRYVMGAVYRF
jgi:MipA family protein